MSSHPEPGPSGSSPGPGGGACAEKERNPQTAVGSIRKHVKEFMGASMDEHKE